MNKICKKCKKPLPNGYKHKKCEACVNEQVRKLKKGLKATAKIASAVGSVVLVVASKRKFSPRK